MSTWKYPARKWYTWRNLMLLNKRRMIALIRDDLTKGRNAAYTLGNEKDEKLLDSIVTDLHKALVALTEATTKLGVLERAAYVQEA